MGYARTCKGCKYYVFTVSAQYRAVIEGCNRQNWDDVKACRSHSGKSNCYVPDDKEEN